ncbi:hypothetical protein STCU_10494 [Strigomonas culicis]|uniref:Uncharacterized protein n=1 Tax=Strigomonas culicis TaxID=28005 RepID=S9V469_9TRYP|nr:hypothetical protein STCU_10494 [Strigomonas culicis]|eukprot:EPY17635.1 hypothetical protein STCU_10494 [Strigomonas culicis]
MEYWVTAGHMHTIVAAVTDSMRDHMSDYAKELAYHPFAEEYSVQDAAETFALPSQQRFFSLVPSRAVQSAVEGGGEGARPATSETAKGFRQRGAELRLSAGDDVSNYFNVSTDGLRALAHEVSSISTEIATQNTAPRLVHDVGDYEVLTRAVFDTMCDLLGDSSIQEAVKRRAVDKYKEVQKSSADFKKKSREDKEKQLIEKAEKEAEQVVQRIMQEMHIQEVTR